MDKKPYTAPELVVLGDVIDITKAQTEFDDNFDQTWPFPPNPANAYYTDNIIP